ncbi:MAG: hypothetical protein KC502_06650 [Myxococcales bacterium]|nr:hypothetical protein [Myxococcales bacterium]
MSTEDKFRRAQQALQKRSEALNTLAETTTDDDMPLLVGASGELVSADTLDAARGELAQPERVGVIVRQTYVAPDPFEGFAHERAEALAPLLAQSQQSFGLSRMPPDFHRLTGTAKLDYLLDLPDPGLTLQALPAEEFVFLAKNIGLSDSAALLSLASPHQLQTLVDLDVWQGDEIDRPRFAHLLAVAVTAGQETVDRFLASQEDGLLCMFLSHSAQVYEDAEEADQLLPDGWESFISPDGTMVVGIPMDDTALAPIRVMLESVYRIDIVRGRRILRATRWELQTSMAEDLYETRNKRTADHGFPSQERARDVYRFIAPAEAKARADALLAGEGAEPGQALPFIPESLSVRADLALHGLGRAPFLAQAVARCNPEEGERLQLAMVRLAYTLQAARARRASETDELAKWSRHALLTADMGLETLSGGDVERGAALLGLMPLSELFSVGHSLVTLLHHRAVRLRRRLGGATAVAGAELGLLLEGLCKPLPGRVIPRPLKEAQDLHADLLADGEDEGAHKAQFEPYERLGELENTRAVLAGIEAAVSVVERLDEGGIKGAIARLSLDMAPGTDHDIELSSLLATAIAWTVVDGEPRLEALPAESAQQFVREAFDSSGGARRIKRSLRAALSRALLSNPALSDEELAPLDSFLGRTLDRLDSELGGLVPGAALDPRFVGTAVILRGG